MKQFNATPVHTVGFELDKNSYRGQAECSFVEMGVEEN